MDNFTNHRIVNAPVVSTSSGSLLSGNCKRLVISSTEDAYINLNTATAVTSANGIYLPKDSTFELELVHISKINFIRDTADGRITVLELF